MACVSCALGAVCALRACTAVYDTKTWQEELDTTLAERQARETGICAVREHLYQQCFDELIREITLDGPERGLLLMRVRDEVRMTIDAFKTLYDSRYVT